MNERMAAMKKNEQQRRRARSSNAPLKWRLKFGECFKICKL